MPEIITEPVNPEKKKGGKHRYLIYLSLVIVVTGLSLFLALKDDFQNTTAALRNSDWRYLLLIIGLVIFSYLVDGLIIFFFSRLYTRRYRYHQGLATSMVGAFFNGVTPSASGGQIMQVYTMRKQGVEPSNGASIMVMSFILYQIVLIIFGTIAVSLKWQLLVQIGTFDINIGTFSIKSIPIILLTFIGFALNISVILLLFLMSYSHKFHNLIMHFGIGFLAKIKIIKNPDRLRESLRIQVENFKIELRRLQSNIPFTILIMLLFAISLISKYCIPWVAGIALDAFNGTATGNISIQSFWDAVFLSSYHQMITGLIPLPGSAGVSEYFFLVVFQGYYNDYANTVAAQIVWRTAIFHLVMLVSGLITAFYRSSPKEHIEKANRQTFIDLQMQTYEERKRSADTLYETARLSRKEVQRKLKNIGAVVNPLTIKSPLDEVENEAMLSDGKKDKSKKPKPKAVKKVKAAGKKPKAKKPIVDDAWDNIDIKG